VKRKNSQAKLTTNATAQRASTQRIKPMITFSAKSLAELADYLTSVAENLEQQAARNTGHAAMKYRNQAIGYREAAVIVRATNITDK
jgi:hypothetical protein